MDDPALDNSGRGRPRRRSTRIALSLLALCLPTATCGCPGEAEGPGGIAEEAGGQIQEVPMSMTVNSAAFAAGAPIPVLHTGDGADTSPPLEWTGAPQEAREFALICDDPDAPTPEPWVHWVIYKIPANVTALPAGVPGAPRVSAPITALQGKNSWTGSRTTGYRGPAPPRGHGVHHYHFRVYALDSELAAGPGLDKRQLLQAMDGHVLTIGELVGTYER